MTLDQYCFGKRPLTLSAEASAHQGLCALDRSVGAVMIEEDRRPIGTATDRDLTLRVSGVRRDPMETQLREVMTGSPRALAVDASELQAASLMRCWHIRRVRLLKSGSIVGIVTLDDLLMSGGVSGVKAENMSEAQVSEPASCKPVGDLHPMRLPNRHQVE